MAAALAAGAAAVRVGTRFLATPEADAHPDYVAALLAGGDDATVVTSAFSIGWPDAPHRVLRSALASAESFDGDIVGVLSVEERDRPVARWSAMTPSRDMSGTVAAMAMYAGDGVSQVTEVTPAAQVVNELAREAARLLGAQR